eukprot:scaffold143663_cov20-Tisochrysis_lutea.AAC.1
MNLSTSAPCPGTALWHVRTLAFHPATALRRTITFQEKLSLVKCAQGVGAGWGGKAGHPTFDEG